MVTLVVSAPNVTELYPKRWLKRQILQDRHLSTHHKRETPDFLVGDGTQPLQERGCGRSGTFCPWGVAGVFGKEVTVAGEGGLGRGGELRVGQELGGPGSGLGGCSQGLAAGRGQRSPGWGGSVSHRTSWDNPVPKSTPEPRGSSLRSTDHLSGPGERPQGNTPSWHLKGFLQISWADGDRTVDTSLCLRK